MIVKNSSLSVDTEKLRKKILDLAIRGKLVPQDSQDEPASVLLEKIKAEKAQLIKEKKIKKSKPLPEITAEEKPFAIPERWKWVRLDDVGVITSGGTPKRNVPEYWNSEDIPWITPAVMGKNKDKVFNGEFEYISEKGLAKSSAQLIKKNSIVFSSRAPIGYINIVPFDFTTNQGCKSFTGIDVYIDYMYYAIKHQVPYIEKNGSGTTFKEISAAVFKSSTVPLPPLAEQKRIVTKIEECMQAIKVIEDSSKDYERLQSQLDKKVLDLAMRGKLVPQDNQDEPASVLLEKIKEEKAQLIKEKKIKKSKPLPEITAEEKPFNIPESWEWVRLGEIFDITSSKRVKKNEWKKRGIPFYRAREIVSISKNEKLKDPIFIDEETYKEKISVSGKPREKDILITGVGTLGIPYIVKPNDKFYFKDGNIIWLKNYFKIIPEYIKYLLFCSYMKKEINNGRGTTVATLTIVRANNLLIPLPPLAEQKRIVAKIEEIKQYLEI